MDEWIEIAKSVTTFIGCITACVTAAGFVVKPLRKRFLYVFARLANTEQTQKNDERAFKAIEALNERLEGVFVSNQLLSAILRDILRNNITHIYYRYRDTKKIPTFEVQNLIAQYESYKKLGGNSYVSHLFEEMCNWETIE